MLRTEQRGKIRGRDEGRRWLPRSSWLPPTDGGRMGICLSGGRCDESVLRQIGATARAVCLVHSKLRGARLGLRRTAGRTTLAYSTCSGMSTNGATVKKRPTPAGPELEKMWIRNCTGGHRGKARSRLAGWRVHPPRRERALGEPQPGSAVVSGHVLRFSRRPNARIRQGRSVSQSGYGRIWQKRAEASLELAGGEQRHRAVRAFLDEVDDFFFSGGGVHLELPGRGNVGKPVTE